MPENLSVFKLPKGFSTKLIGAKHNYALAINFIIEMNNHQCDKLNCIIMIMYIATYGIVILWIS